MSLEVVETATLLQYSSFVL